MRKFVFIWLAAVLATACTEKGGGEEQQPSLKVKETSLRFAASGNESQTVAVEAVAVEWTCAVSGSSSEWITATKTDDSTISVTVTDNETSEPRSGIISVSAEDHPEMKVIGISVSQEAGEATEYSITVNPASLEFEHDSTEAQEVTVTAVGEGLGWTAAAETGASWIHVDVQGDKLSVTVDGYENTEQNRAANIVVTPDREGVAPKSIRVTQSAAPEQPSLTVSPDSDLEIEYNDTGIHYLSVTATAASWRAAVEYVTESEEKWVNLQINRVEDELSGSLYVSCTPNSQLEPREAKIIVSSESEEVEDVVINIRQEAGKGGFLSSLTDHVNLSDMAPAGGFYYYLSPAQKWDKTTPCTEWRLELWGSGLTRSLSGGTYVYEGTGNVLKMTVYSDRINYNDDELFYLPDGTYEVYTYQPFPGKEDQVANTVVQGRETYNLEIQLSHSWYLNIVDGKIDTSAPLWDGSMTVSRGSDDTYTIQMNFKDDMGWDISGVFVSKVTESKINFWERPDPGESEDPDPDPEDPDPGFGQ